MQLPTKLEIVTQAHNTVSKIVWTQQTRQLQLIQTRILIQTQTQTPIQTPIQTRIPIHRLQLIRTQIQIQIPIRTRTRIRQTTPT